MSFAFEVLDTILTHLRPKERYVFGAVITCTAIWVTLRWFRISRQKVRTTQLRGPPSESFIYGVGKRITDTDDAGAVYEQWAKEYGPVFVVPSTLGRKRIILCDPKAIAHYYAKETWTYVHTAANRALIADFLGKGLIWAEGDDHKRQRRSLAAGFSFQMIRELTPIFYDSAYKAKAAWDALIESSNGDNALIDVQLWMNRISLDSIGLAGFSHNFGALEGNHASNKEIFDVFNPSSSGTAVSTGIFLLSQVAPFLLRIPTARVFHKFGKNVEEISNELFARTQKEMELGVVEGKEERSVIGLLIKRSKEGSMFHLTKDEVISQMKVILVAGYESTSISLTWALIELSRNPDVQTKLRNELLEYGADPTFDQITNDLPYLDAVVHEILRIHPPGVEHTRVATEDDVIPLSEPVRTTCGELVSSITVAKGTFVAISAESINRSIAIWGEDAKVFRPSRWLVDASGQDGIPVKAKEVQGHRHLLTFVDGPRMCPGKTFALTESKVVLAVLVKNFVFELRDGVDSKIETVKGILQRPKIAGETGCNVPLRVRPYAG